MDDKGKRKKIVGARHYGGAVLILLLLLGAMFAGAQARDLTAPEEAALYSFADLGPMDFTPKKVEVEVYISPDPELDACRRMSAQVWEQVQQFYARLGVILVSIPGQSEPGKLAPAQRLRIEVLTDKQWLARSFTAFNVAPPFRLRFLQVCKDKCAFAHLPLSTVQISFKRFQDAETGAAFREGNPNRNWLANLLIHELGHLLGLYHYHEFTNDPVATSPRERKTANFMGNKIAFKTSLGFVEFQRRLVHSYLGKGKVFQQYAQVDYDPLRYLELVKRHNGFREPLPHVAKMAQKVGKKGRTKTFDGEDDEDDED